MFNAPCMIYQNPCHLFGLHNGSNNSCYLRRWIWEWLLIHSLIIDLVKNQISLIILILKSTPGSVFRYHEKLSRGEHVSSDVICVTSVFMSEALLHL